MNKTEASYAVGLEALKRAGEIHDWRYEALTLKLGPDLRYTPDFMVIHTDGRLDFRETKGFWRDDAKVKIRAACRQFPWFTFTAHRKSPHGWTTEAYSDG